MAKIEHVEITDGLHWVNIPEADLRILCGCPADSVKHLMNGGLITTKQTGDVEYETGPNSVLLSDILIQHGSFCNLAEFPVLQMLYHQGMILPGHPNNTGIRPLLIGTENQVKAQLEYIYRGNYGLISEEEILSTGLDPELAKEWMRLKLKFAFGTIHPSEDLLDSLIVGSQPIEIRNGVIIHRDAVNIYDISYGGESVTVDLNLRPESTYFVPYDLGYHHIDRDYFGIVHSGDGDGWDENRPSMSSLLMYKGRYYLIDAGPNIDLVLQALGISPNELAGLFHTHAHDDHFAGLSCLANTERRLKYYATPMVRASVQKKMGSLAALDEQEFNHLYEVHDLEYGQWNDIDSLAVKPILSPHPVETNILLFRAEDGRKHKSYGHFADIVALDVFSGMITEDGSQSGVSQDFFDDIKKKYLEPVSLKKIDVGGGLIHGSAEDFRDDKSDRIVLSHTSKPLTDKQKEIGPRSIFGSMDVLIHSEENFSRHIAEAYLRYYYPEASDDQVADLLTEPIKVFEPDSVLIEPFLIPDELYLVIGGTVEMKGNGVNHMLSAGALIGELPGVMDENSQENYKAMGYVEALVIPVDKYIDFIEQVGHLDRTRELSYKRKLLQSSRLFGESLSYTVQTKLASLMTESRFEEGHEFDQDNHDTLFLVGFGIVDLSNDGRLIETLYAGDVFGVDSVLTGTAAICDVKARTEVEIYAFPAKILTNIPIIRWKLFEIYKRRRRKFLDPKSEVTGTNSP
ncbi:cyclic nucleotide-binding domain-containing protein [Candidatus Neomarinimicrobiota bacterium]